MPASAEDIVKAYGLPLENAQAIVDTSNQLGFADPAMLANVINFESKFRPDIQNKIGATGLIQFIPSTAAALGTSTAALKKMSFVEQMDWVYFYLQPYSKRIKTQEDLYMAIFYPVAIGNADYVFPVKVQEANNGIRTPRDYTRMANARAKLTVDYGGKPAQPPVTVTVVTSSSSGSWMSAVVRNPLTYVYLGMGITVGMLLIYRSRSLQTA